MIRALISDLDNTLFLGHGETVFDLTARNAEGLAELREAQVALYTASGRMSAFGEELLRRNGFTDIRSSGFDGASGTDQGRIAWQYGLEKEDALRALGIVNESGFRISRHRCRHSAMIATSQIHRSRLHLHIVLRQMRSISGGSWMCR